jgi:hypothetical protein
MGETLFFEWTRGVESDPVTNVRLGEADLREDDEADQREEHFSRHMG